MLGNQELYLVLCGSMFQPQDEVFCEAPAYYNLENGFLIDEADKDICLRQTALCAGTNFELGRMKIQCAALCQYISHAWPIDAHCKLSAA